MHTTTNISIFPFARTSTNPPYVLCDKIWMHVNLLPVAAILNSRNLKSVMSRTSGKAETFWDAPSSLVGCCSCFVSLGSTFFTCNWVLYVPNIFLSCKPSLSEEPKYPLVNAPCLALLSLGGEKLAMSKILVIVSRNFQQFINFNCSTVDYSSALYCIHVITRFAPPQLPITSLWGCFIQLLIKN